MDHQVNMVVAPIRAPGDPECKPDVERSVAEALRHPLHEQVSGPRAAIKLRAQPAQVTSRKGVQFFRDRNIGDDGRGRGSRWTPYVNPPCGAQRRRHGEGVVANSAHHGRVLTGDDVPLRHATRVRRRHEVRAAEQGLVPM